MNPIEQIKIESIQTLKDYQTEIKETALWIYGMPYSQLPQDTQRIVRKEARNTMEQNIYNLTSGVN